MGVQAEQHSMRLRQQEGIVKGSQHVVQVHAVNAAADRTCERTRRRCASHGTGAGRVHTGQCALNRHQQPLLQHPQL